MNDPRIIYADEQGSVMVITPSLASDLTVEQIGEKDTPTGLSFWVVDASTLPDRAFRNAWELDAEAMGKPSGVGADK